MCVCAHVHVSYITPTFSCVDQVRSVPWFSWFLQFVQEIRGNMQIKCYKVLWYLQIFISCIMRPTDFWNCTWVNWAYLCIILRYQGSTSSDSATAQTTRAPRWPTTDHMQTMTAHWKRWRGRAAGWARWRRCLACRQEGTAPTGRGSKVSCTSTRKGRRWE